MKESECAIVFDWNGTLLDDAVHCCEAMNAAIAVIGTSPMTIETYRREYAMPLMSFYERVGCDPQKLAANLTQVFDTFGSMYDATVNQTFLREGAKEVLSFLSAQGHRAAILSNHTVEMIAGQVKRFGIDAHFDAILANKGEEMRDIMHKADKGSRLKAYVEKYGIRRALVVGDSAEEIHIAHHYGFLGVGIEGGFCAAERIRAARPDFMIQSLTELPAIAREVFALERKVA
ncbi:MAG: HAD hydrolase-like protein [Alphaproteobacteria bacterium]|nr:HAD hydrolase-like protein [Alphaproteobacteria bacterium]